MPAIGAAEHLGEQEDERQNRQNGDVAAGHVRRKSHRQRERPHEHAHDFDRNQQDVDRPRQPGGTRFIQCLTKPCALVPAMMIAPKVIGRERRGDVEVRRRRGSAVQDALQEGVLAGAQHVMIDQPEHFEDRNQSRWRWRRG